ncbi:hypothetical protein ACFW2V_13940 [Streptomyces sp. NPDC058947]|uniref:hypothetical protein n=1 Tax=Streptomyces sp. NPDC058947 TaxID=3346675 RepID=UPI00369ADF10
MVERKDVYPIGDEYSNRAASRKGVAVIRPAILEAAFSGEPRIITTSPCCVTQTRRLNFNDVTSDLAIKQGGWSEKCRHCKWHYRVLAEHTGQDIQLGLYGVRWISQGF